MSRNRERWSEADVIAHMQRQGLPLTPALTLAKETPEGVLLAQVRKLAKEQSFLSYHTHDSRKSEKGFPDLVLARPVSASSRGRLIFAELKEQRGKATAEQALWLDVLRHTLPDLEVYFWMPSDYPTIVDILTRKEHP
jgi:hypothetical protein